MEHSEAKLFTEDDLNDDLNKKYAKCKCVYLISIDAAHDCHIYRSIIFLKKLKMKTLKKYHRYVNNDL